MQDGNELATVSQSEGNRATASSFFDFITQHDCQKDLAANSAHRHSAVCVPTLQRANAWTNYSHNEKQQTFFTPPMLIFDY